MAQTTPLLQPFPAAEPADPVAPLQAQGKICSTTSIDDMIERCVGSLGPAQLFQAILVSFARVFDAQQTFINVFSDAAPSWHRTSPDARSSTCTSLPAPCGLPAGNWTWDRPPHASVVSEWSLECIGSSVAGLPASAYFAGCLVGGLSLATLADSALGRKKMLFLSCLGMAVAGLLTAASPSVWVYASLRFLAGFSRSTIGSSILVLSTELVGKKWRGEVGIIGFFCFAIGFLSLPALAYANRNASWRVLYLWTSAPALFYSVLVYFLVRESPRWLLVRGRREEAIKILKDIAASNGKDVSEFNVYVNREEEYHSRVDVNSALKVLVEKRWVMRRLASVMAAGFGIGMVYYGMPLAVGSLGTNLYLSVALNALTELPSDLITLFLIGRINRRGAVLGFTLASGSCAVACIFLEDARMKMGMEVASYFCACVAYNVLLIYTLELFATCVRSSTLSMVRQALVLGGVIAPLQVAAARGMAGRLTTFGVFGLVIACCGMFVVCLPETRGGGICDSLEEQECKEKSAAGSGAGGGEGKRPLV